MTKPNYFNTWIDGSKWGIRIVLFLLLFCCLTSFSAFALTQNYVVSAFGAEPEDITFALYLTYAGIITMIPVQARFVRYFEIKSYLLSVFLMAMFLNVLMMMTNDLTVFFILRFFCGMTLCCGSACMLILIFSRLQTEKMAAIGSSVFYGSVLGGAILISVASAFVDNTMDWRGIYKVVIGFQIVCLGIILCVMNKYSGHKKYPLYRFDWTGVVLFIPAVVGLAYTIIYGTQYYWFSDQRIVTSFVITVVFVTLFVYRQLTVRRPLINLTVFKHRNFIIGLILLGLYYGLKDSLNLVYGYTAAVLHWNVMQTIELALVNLLGMVLAMYVAALTILSKRHSIRRFLIAGFGVMLVYNIYLYYLLTPDLAFSDLIAPVFLQGVTSGILFVPLMIFTTSSVPKETGMTGLIVCAYTRFISAINSATGFHNLQHDFNQHFRESFLGKISLLDPVVTEKMNSSVQLFKGKGFTTEQATAIANSGIARQLEVQSQLLTSKSIFLLVAGVVVVILVLIAISRSVNKTFLHISKSMFMIRGRN